MLDPFPAIKRKRPPGRAHRSGAARRLDLQLVKSERVTYWVAVQVPLPPVTPKPTCKAAPVKLAT